MSEVRKSSERPRRIACREAPGKGRGIFALEPIAEGEVIERAPVLVISESDTFRIEETALAKYQYVWLDSEDESPRICALVFGYGMLYNHSFEPNAIYRRSYATLEMDFIALKDISEGKEICINYNGNPKDQSPVWFEVEP